MAHINFLTVTYTSLLLFLVCILLSGKFTWLFYSDYGGYFIWLYVLLIAELIMLSVFIMYYQDIYYKRGKQGKRGKHGDRGFTGRNADCNKCEVMLGNNI